MNCPTVYSVEDFCIWLTSKFLDNDLNTITVTILNILAKEQF